MNFDLEPVLQNLFDSPENVKRVLRGKPVRKRGNTLDPDMQLLMKAQSLTPSLHRVSTALMREQLRLNSLAMTGDAPSMRITRWHHVNDDVQVKEYQPRHIENGFCMMYLHGGGWSSGSVETHDAVCRRFAAQLGVKVFSVEYRLAPEAPFPAPLNDCMVAWQWLQEQAESLDVNPQKIVIAGDSAGGNLAAVVSQQCVQQALCPPCLQVLIYPSVDLYREYDAEKEFGKGFFLTLDLMRWFNGNYFGPAGKKVALDPRMSPMRAIDVKNMPPAIVTVAGFDPLQDAGRDYAKKLQAENNQVVLLEEPTLIHGYVNMAGLIPSAFDAFKRISSNILALLKE